jgi:hypothetical protein
LLRGLHAALSDQPKQAKEQFHNALWQDMDRSAVKALIALGIPATPADESLAVAYFQAYKAEIQRKNKKSDSPVTRISSTGNNVTDEDLFFLSSFSQLRDLQLSSAWISDAELIHVEHLAALRHLQLNCAEITDAGLKHLHKLKHLESVNLRGTKVTDKGIAELRKVFPKIDISR